jgi:hypothetical protein
MMQVWLNAMAFKNDIAFFKVPTLMLLLLLL